MCGRFSLFHPQTDVEERFDATFREAWQPRYNIAPGDDVAVITNDAPETIAQFEWGLVPHWVDDPDDWDQHINARAESVDEKASFREAFRGRRCLVLADGFYEWRGAASPKTPYRIERDDDEPVAFAGLWEIWGEERDTVTLVTTAANAVLRPIHDRMPVVLEADEERDWLEVGDADELRAMLDPYPDDGLGAFEVSTAVNDPANDSPAVVEPVGHGQAGLGEF